jgi:Fe2+ or Zn2+ uptake regulation protein
MNKTDTNQASLLRKTGLKATDQRLAILTVLKKTKQPLSSQEIIAQLGTTFDAVTVYRTVKTLLEKGLIRQIDLRQNNARYEMADLDDHHHLVCVQCGRIEDISGCIAEDMQEDILKKTKHFAEIRDHSLEFYGLCKNCAKKKPA